MKKLLTALFAVSLLALVSCASKDEVAEAAEPAAPAVSEAKAAAMAEAGALDLGSFESVDSWAIKYNDEAYELKLNGCEFVQFKLDNPITAGDVLTVHLTGVNNGKNGFRSWVVDDHQTTNCPNPDGLYYSTKDESFGQGEFDITYQLECVGDSTYLFLKGIQWGTMIDGITLKSVAVSVN